MPHENRHTEPGYIYFMVLLDERATEDSPAYVKIGYATDPQQRRHQLKTSMPFDLEIEATFPGSKDDEKSLHLRLAKDRVRREWFLCTDEVDDLLADLLDAAFMIKTERGDDYEPTLQECLDYKEPREAFDNAFCRAEPAVIEAVMAAVTRDAKRT